MPAGFVDLWASGSIPWVEIILVLVVVNVLLLSGGGSKKGLLLELTEQLPLETAEAHMSAALDAFGY